MPQFRCRSSAFVAALTGAAAMVAALLSTSAFAATVPLNGRSFDQACAAAAPGDTITVPAGNIGRQTLTCAKPVTFQGQGASTALAYLSLSGANGPTVAGAVMNGVEVKGASNVTVRAATITNQTYIERGDGVLFDRVAWEPAAGGTTWDNGDMIDIYPATNGTPNHNITIQDSVLHGLRAPNSSAHPDAIQLYNTGQPHTGIRILRTRFYDNECINLRTNEGDEVLLENNVFGDSVTGVTGCGSYAIDVGYAQVTARNNTFVGNQQVQETPTTSGLHQVWVGNVGVGLSDGCTGGGAAGARFSRNVWTRLRCGTDKQVSSRAINASGAPLAGSAVIDAGDPSDFPAGDFDSHARPFGAAPDAGAYEFGSTGPVNPGAGAGVQFQPGPIAPVTPAPAPPPAAIKAGSLTFGSGSKMARGARGASVVTLTAGKRIYVRVRVSGLQGRKVRSARLQLRVLRGSKRSLFVRLAGLGKRSHAVLAKVKRGWAEANVSRFVAADGVYTFVVSKGKGTKTRIATPFSKRFPPRLVIRVG